MYFLCSTVGRDLFNNFFQLVWVSARPIRIVPGIITSFQSDLAEIWGLATSVLQAIEWWSAWKFKVESKGKLSGLCPSLTFPGKGNGLGVWRSAHNMYWPFASEKEALDFLDSEFAIPSPSRSKGCSLISGREIGLAKLLPYDILSKYLEQKKCKYGSARAC
jgi:hypothetical protein